MIIREVIILPGLYWKTCIAGLEKGARGLAFASGLAAIDAILKLLKSAMRLLP